MPPGPWMGCSGILMPNVMRGDPVSREDIRPFNQSIDRDTRFRNPRRGYSRVPDLLDRRATLCIGAELSRDCA